MKRGYALVELIIAAAILGAGMTVLLRMQFAIDSSVGAEVEHIAGVGVQAQLLADLGTDVRGARAVTGGGSTLTIGGTRQIRYAWDDVQEATLRTAAAGLDNLRVYPGVRANFRPRGAVVFVTLTANERTVGTAYYLRTR